MEKASVAGLNKTTSGDTNQQEIEMKHSDKGFQNHDEICGERTLNLLTHCPPPRCRSLPTYLLLSLGFVQPQILHLLPLPNEPLSEVP